MRLEAREAETERVVRRKTSKFREWLGFSGQELGVTLSIGEKINRSKA